MIILDTNVVSEPLKPRPDTTVLAWLDRQAPEALYLTAVSVAELLDGKAISVQEWRVPMYVFTGAMLLLLSKEDPAYAGFQADWNRRNAPKRSHLRVVDENYTDYQV